MKTLILLLTLAAPAAAQVIEAESLFFAGHYDKANLAFKALAQNPKDQARAVYFLGRIALVRAERDSAVGLLERAVSLDSTTTAYRVWLGKAIGEVARNANPLRQPSLVAKSRAQQERAVAQDPENLEARRALAEFYAVAPAMFGGGKPKARAQASEIKKRNQYEGLLAMAWVLADGNDPQGAERELLEAVRVYPDSVEPARALTDLYLSRLNRGGDAYRVVTEFLMRHEDSMVMRYAVARVGAVTGEHLEEAERHLTSYLAYTPRYGEANHSGAHYRLGMVRQKLGDNAGAKAHYEEALRLDRTNTPAKDALASLR